MHWVARDRGEREVRRASLAVDEYHAAVDRYNALKTRSNVDAVLLSPALLVGKPEKGSISGRVHKLTIPD